jgi:hypothetical protein
VDCLLWLCCGTEGRETEGGFVCVLNIEGCVVVEWEEGQFWFNLWIGYCSLRSGNVGRGIGCCLDYGLDTACFVVVQRDERQGWLFF